MPARAGPEVETASERFDHRLGLAVEPGAIADRAAELHNEKARLEFGKSFEVAFERLAPRPQFVGDGDGQRALHARAPHQDDRALVGFDLLQARDQRRNPVLENGERRLQPRTRLESTTS